MTVELVIHLFGKPSWELEDLEGDLAEGYSARLRVLGDELKKRLHDIAFVFDLLVKNGWQPYGTLYDINFSKDVNMKEAKRELETLRLEEYMLNLIELEKEEEV